MNTILTIDTSSTNCAVGLQRGDVLLERVSEAQRQSAQRVLPMISELLLDAKIQLSDIDIIAVVAGPGSFTGVRIGVAVAQGLSMSAAIPVVPLSSLALLAIAIVSQSTIYVKLNTDYPHLLTENEGLLTTQYPQFLNSTYNHVS